MPWFIRNITRLHCATPHQLGTITLTLVFIITLTGCTTFYAPIQTSLEATIEPAVLTQMNRIDVSSTEPLTITRSLLELIDDPNLHHLVATGLAHNHDLRQTAYRLEAAGYLANIESAHLLPELSAELTTHRTTQGMDLTTGETMHATTHRVGINLSWELDLWGRLLDTQRASHQQVAAQHQDLVHLRDALGAHIIASWINLTGHTRAVSLQQERNQIFQELDTISRDMYRNGLITLDSLTGVRQRCALCAVETTSRVTARRQAIRQLELLLGMAPETLSVDIPSTLPQIPHPYADAPARTLLNRPDIRSALARTDAALYTARAAKKARYPSLSLTTNLFKENTALNELAGATSAWTILGSALQPVFQAGRLRNMARAERCQADAALQDLKHVVLKAITEVHQSLETEKALQHQLKEVAAAETAAHTNANDTKDRYTNGLTTIDTMLLAKDNWLQIQQTHAETTAQWLANRIALALAIGIGINPSDFPSVTL